MTGLLRAALILASVLLFTVINETGEMLRTHGLQVGERALVFGVVLVLMAVWFAVFVAMLRRT